MNEYDFKSYRPYEDEKEKASTAYLMSLVAMIIGLPMPIINLLATFMFFLMARKGTAYVKWHSTQALLSQIPLFLMNNILFWWTIRILIGWNELSSMYFTYFIVVNVYNVYDLIETTISAVRTRKGVHHQWGLYGEMTNWIRHTAPVSPMRIIAKAVLFLAFFFGSLFAINQINWMERFHLRPTIVTDTLSDVIWNSTSYLMQVEDRDSTVLPVDSLVNNLCLANGIDSTTIKVHLSSSSEINAFSTIGNHIVVNRGLIGNCKNQQELSGVLAHELAHITQKHTSKAMQEQLAITAVMLLISGNSNSSRARDLAAELLRTSFSRDKETEADDCAVKYLQKAHQDPREMARFMRRMESVGVLEYVTDHPDSEKRAKRIMGQCKGMKISSRNVLDRTTWLRLKREAGTRPDDSSDFPFDFDL